MNQHSLTNIGLNFKRRNNLIPIKDKDKAEKNISDLMTVVKEQLKEDDKVKYGLLSNRENLVDSFTNLEVLVNYGKLKQSHYMMIDLDKVRDASVFKAYLIDIKEEANKSKNVNPLILGFTSLDQNWIDGEIEEPATDMLNLISGLRESEDE